MSNYCTNQTILECLDQQTHKINEIVQKANNGDFNGQQGIQGEQGKQGIQGWSIIPCGTSLAPMTKAQIDELSSYGFIQSFDLAKIIRVDELRVGDTVALFINCLDTNSPSIYFGEIVEITTKTITCHGRGAIHSGLKGDKGDQGIQGPAGPKGDKGESGDVILTKNNTFTGTNTFNEDISAGKNINLLNGYGLIYTVGGTPYTGFIYNESYGTRLGIPGKDLTLRGINPTVDILGNKYKIYHEGYRGFLQEANTWLGYNIFVGLGGGSIAIKDNKPNGHNYLPFLANDNTRKGWVGYGSDGTTNMMINNAIGDVLLLAKTGSSIIFDSPIYAKKTSLFGAKATFNDQVEFKSAPYASNNKGFYAKKVDGTIKRLVGIDTTDSLVLGEDMPVNIKAPKISVNGTESFIAPKTKALTLTPTTDTVDITGGDLITLDCTAYNDTLRTLVGGHQGQAINISVYGGNLNIASNGNIRPTVTAHPQSANYQFIYIGNIWFEITSPKA